MRISDLANRGVEYRPLRISLLAFQQPSELARNSLDGTPYTRSTVSCIFSRKSSTILKAQFRADDSDTQTSGCTIPFSRLELT